MDEDRQESEREPFMNFHVLTLFPEMVEGGLRESIIGRALSKGVISLETVNIRAYTSKILLKGP